MNAGPETPPIDLARREPPHHEDLRELYAELDAELARLGPVCLASGRCCRFLEYGHTLFVSEPEMDYLLAEAPTPARTLDDGETCPWQNDSGHCTARRGRPLGCRIYHCDPSFQEAAPALSEQFIGRLKTLVQRHGLPWNYAPLHRHLQARNQDGRFPALAGQSPSS
jgi:hypothetical protein